MPSHVTPRGNPDFEPVFGPVLEQIVGLLEAEAGVLWVWEETAAAYVPALCRGRGSWAAPWSPSHPEGIGRGDLDPSQETLLFDDLPPDSPLPAGGQKNRPFAGRALSGGGGGG